MEKTAAGWTIIDREAAVLARNYEFAPNASATTFTARMENGELLIISPCTGLTDEAAAELLEFGKVGAMVASNGFHHLGQVEWRERFPSARNFASPESAARIKKKSKATLDFEPLSDLIAMTGPKVGVREVPNTKVGEMWAWVEIAGGYAWYVSDILANMPSLPKSFVPKMLFKLSKSAPGYKVFHLGLKFMVKDKKATLRLLLDDMKAHEPTVVVPAHGEILSQKNIAAETHAVIEAAL